MERLTAEIEQHLVLMVMKILKHFLTECLNLYLIIRF